jgi:hypothetical protein
MSRRRRFDEDEDYDRPRRRRVRDDSEDDLPSRDRGQGKEFPVWIPLLIGGGVLALAVAGTLAYFLLRPARQQQRIVAPVADAMPDQPQVAFNPPPRPANPPMGAGKRIGNDHVTRLRANTSANQLLFGGGEEGHIAIVSHSTRGGYDVEVFKTRTGQGKGTVHLTSLGIDGHSLSPEGDYLAEVNSAPFEGNAVTVYRTSDGNAANKFTPYPRAPRDLGKVGQLVWISLLPGNKLLTINERGGHDVWSVPDFQRVHGEESTLTDGHLIRRNGFTHMPENFALTPDGKTLAIFDGTGFTFFNTFDGKELGRTEPIVARGQSFNSWGCAFRADGTQLAFLSTRNNCTLAVFDVKSGKKLSEVNADSGAGISWWGKEHVLLHAGGISSARIISVATGQHAGDVRFPRVGKLGPSGPGDQLWGYSEGVLIHSAPPAIIRAGSSFDLTAEGVFVR